MGLLVYRNIVTFAFNGEDHADRLEFALQVAAAHDAHLTVVTLDDTPYDPSRSHGPLNAVVTGQEHDLEARLRVAKTEFLGKGGQLGVACDWLVARQHEAHRAIAFARGFDLVITGLTGTSARKSHSLRAFPEHLILEGGRPVLFQPCEGGGSTSFDHIVVLWNGSREAARAIHDAMPLLQRATRVEILTASPPPGRNESGTALHEPAIGHLLARHGVSADHVVNACAPDAGDWLLARAQGMNKPADLLVSGAYGRSSLQELLFGGVTRQLLRETGIPLLMSH